LAALVLSKSALRIFGLPLKTSLIFPVWTIPQVLPGKQKIESVVFIVNDCPLRELPAANGILTKISIMKKCVFLNQHQRSGIQPRYEFFHLAGINHPPQSWHQLFHGEVPPAFVFQ
jgi:hypothetical protein